MAERTDSFEFSQVGRKLTARTGILELMDDLGRAMTTDPHMLMLGGGNPAPVPEIQSLVRQRMKQMLDAGEPFDQMIANYDPPQGNPRFISALAGLLKRAFGWEIGPHNIAITCGGQSAFFYLFNLLGGRMENGRHRKILLPMAPEYIGYADQGVDAGLFVACKPALERPVKGDPHVFKYRIDFQQVQQALDKHDIGAIAVSRPTNPSGNVLTDAEVGKLSALAGRRGIPLIIDNAYGSPFPGVIYADHQPHWAPHVILTLSLSKLGLPGTRTGIVVAPESIVKALIAMTAIAGLSNGTIGQRIVLPWIEDGSILQIGPRILRPFYESRGLAAAGWMHEIFNKAGVDWAMHASEGAFFHWLWLPSLSISTMEFYQRLKKREVLIVPGEYFFYGMEEDWPHRRQCLRLNFSRPPEVVKKGLQILAEEAARAQKTELQRL